MKCIKTAGFGGVDVLRVTEEAQPSVSAEDVLVKVYAAGVNRADLLQRMGKYPPPPGESDILGLEIAGEIVAVGEACTSWRVGDRVFGLVGGGGYAEYCLLDSKMAMRIPDDWSYVEAAAVPEAFMTADMTVFELGELKAGETLLLHAAASGVGTAALQMAKYCGARVIGSVSQDEKVRKILSLGADVAINYKKQDLFETLHHITSGVDVIEDFIGGAYLKPHLHLLNPGGRLIVVSLLQGHIGELDMRLLLSKRLQIKGSVMRSRTLEDKRTITARFVARWLPILMAGDIKPVIDKTFSFEEVQAAHTYVASNQTKGKVILENIG